MRIREAGPAIEAQPAGDEVAAQVAEAGARLPDLRRACEPVARETALALLAELSLRYWRPDMTPGQFRQLYAGYLEDLGHLPADLFRGACRRYRVTPGSRFFPQAWELLALVEGTLAERRLALAEAERVAAYRPPTPQEIAEAKRRREAAEAEAAAMRERTLALIDEERAKRGAPPPKPGRGPEPGFPRSRGVVLAEIRERRRIPMPGEEGADEPA